MKVFCILLILSVCWYNCAFSATPVQQQQQQHQPRDLPCPNAEDILPCVCLVDDDYGMVMDCSNVTSNSQLASIFSGDLPFKDFYQLKIYNNYDLTSLRVGDFGEATFNTIDIGTGILNRIEYNTFMYSYNTLTRLYIYTHNITYFPFEEVQNFTQLTRLYLYNNQLVGFPTLTSNTLQKLDLSSNPLGEMPADSLVDLPSLTGVYMINIGISEMLPGTFTGLTNLEEINFSHNNLGILQAGTILLQTSFNNVYLDYNNLSYIEEGALTGMRGGLLDVSFNQLTVLAEAVFKPFLDQGSDSVILLAFDNPLLCGCEIAWLITNSTFMEQLSGYESCGTGESLTDLDPDLYLQMCDLTM